MKLEIVFPILRVFFKKFMQKWLISQVVKSLYTNQP